jgi:hypothetical protein
VAIGARLAIGTTALAIKMLCVLTLCPGVCFDTPVFAAAFEDGEA